MNLLVIGGSYFYGRVFVMEAAGDHQLTLLNRGTYSMKDFGVKEIKGDRHDKDVLAGCTEDYDAVIDFCAYEAGDVKTVIENLPGKIGQYILISTVDVYERGSGVAKTEEHPLEHRIFPGGGRSLYCRENGSGRRDNTGMRQLEDTVDGISSGDSVRSLQLCAAGIGLYPDDAVKQGASGVYGCGRKFPVYIRKRCSAGDTAGAWQ